LSSAVGFYGNDVKNNGQTLSVAGILIIWCSST